MALRPDDWLRDLQSLESYGNDLLHKVVLRNQQPRAGLQASRLEGQINVMLPNFNKKILNLQTQLEGHAESGAISGQESRRRQRLLDSLITKREEINTCMQNQPSSARNQLLGVAAAAGSGPAVRGNENSDPQTEGPTDYRQMTRQLQEEQDRGLDVLDQIITRQKGLVRGIGNQIDVQNEIIEDIDGNMDTTQVRLVRNTRNIERISKKADSCCYWLIIVLLLIAIIVASVV